MEMLHIPGPWPLSTNTFLLFTGAGHAVVVDPAADVNTYLEEAAKRGAVITHLLLTHGHYDHVGAVQELKRRTGAQVWMDPADAQGSQMFPLASSDQGYPVSGEFTIDDLTFRCWHTPGHTPGSWCLWCDGVLFSGDTLFAGSCGRVDLPGGSATQMQASLSLLANLPLPDETTVCPGHEDFSTLGRERRTNPYLLGDWY